MQLLQYLFSPAFATAGLITLGLTALSMVLGVLGGLILTGLTAVPFPPVRWLAGVYIWLFRGTPVLLQLIFVFNVLPLVGLRFSSFSCAVIALSLNEAAYMAEIIRGGSLGIDRGQRTAAHMLGLTRWQTLVHVVWPQLLRLVLPPTGNQLIGMLKTSALASVVAVSDLMLVAQRTAAGNFDYVNTLVAAAIYYLALTTLCTWLVRTLERRVDPETKAFRRRKQRARPATTEEVPA
jgi:polar amino acid transport system permease protein